ncbi:MAG: HAD family phosphatase [Candidatus Saccharimonas sp.]
MIRGIIFDCFGVLYGSSAEVSRAICPEELHRDFDDLTKQADYGYITGDEYLRQLSDLLDRPYDELYELFRERHVRNEVLAHYVQTLRPKYRVGLLSNVSSGTIDRLISPTEQTEWFDEVALSCDIHLIKPDPEIFKYVAERLGLLPEECVMIDDRAENCEGASRAGMHTVWFASNDQAIGELERLLARNDG